MGINHPIDETPHHKEPPAGTPVSALGAPVIDLDRLEVRLGGRTVLDGLTGQLRGNAIGLLGPNGAGKSTLIYTLLGFYTPSRGAARVFGIDTRQEHARIRQRIGFMPENHSFIGNMSG